ncbi:MAG: diguanylate cyclase, partial [Gammaproteobacteria bacterium]|nr:diguanylate cyclase [Gammaproteobacteria bacterium]
VMNRALTAALAVIPIITVVLCLTSGSQAYLWIDPALFVADDGFIGWQAGYGPWMFVQIIYGHSLAFAATVIVLFELSASSTMRRPLWAVASAWAIVALCNGLYLAPFNPWPWFDLTVLGFAVAIAILNRRLLQPGLLEVNPMLRREVVEQLSDAVVIADHSGQILDLNPAAASLLGLGLDQALRTNIESRLSTPMLDSLLNGTSGVVSVEDRFYDVKSTVLRSNGDFVVEVALVFRDVTEQLKTHERLERLTAEFEKAANTDSLTQLSNRRYFRQRLEAEISHVERHRTELSVLLLDLDQFKRVNDTYGHDVGDRVLQVIGNIISEFKRVADVAARLGGEEFALLLPSTDLEGAVRVAQRLRKTIEEHVISDRNRNPIRVTVSIGVATASAEKPSSDRTLTEADRALYRAKHAGRNRVCTPA